MIVNILFSALSIYPWNINGSLFYTNGEYSNGNSSVSTAVYWAMDDRQKTNFVVGYEELIITLKAGEYRQYNFLTKDMFWIKNSLRLGGIAGRITSNYEDNGWVLGGLAEGELPWIGYSLGMIQSNFQQWRAFGDLGYEWENVDAIQLNGSMSRRFGSFIIYWGEQVQKFRDDTFRTHVISVDKTIHEKIRVVLSGSTGESRYSIDPYSLVLNNNAEVLHRSFTGKITYRLHPNWYVHGIYANQKYENFSIKYVSAGIQCRF